MEIKHIQQGQAFATDNTGKITGEICWFIDNVATRKELKEIFKEHLEQGWEIKALGHNEYLLIKRGIRKEKKEEENVRVAEKIIEKK